MTTPGGKGRFPGYDVLEEQDAWDAVTTGVVLARLGPPPAAAFFTPDEEAVARPLLDRLLAQDEDPRIPVFELIDARLVEKDTDGWRYADMPEDGEAWRQSLAALDAEAKQQHGCRFCDLARRPQHDLLEAVRTGDRWHDLPAPRVWSLWMRYALAAFYAHPWSWNEIGFGGPAYPRGYKALGLDGREPWEVRDADGTDPIAWTRRIEAAWAAHDDGQVRDRSQR